MRLKSNPYEVGRIVKHWRVSTLREFSTRSLEEFLLSIELLNPDDFDGDMLDVYYAYRAINKILDSREF